jgi:hypothetical protein
MCVALCRALAVNRNTEGYVLCHPPGASCEYLRRHEHSRVSGLFLHEPFSVQGSGVRDVSVRLLSSRFRPFPPRHGFVTKS